MRSLVLSPVGLHMMLVLMRERFINRPKPEDPKEPKPEGPSSEEPGLTRQQRRARERAERKGGRHGRA